VVKIISTLVRSDQFPFADNMTGHRSKKLFFFKSGFHIQSGIQCIKLKMIVMHAMSGRRRWAAIPNRVPGVFALQTLWFIETLQSRDLWGEP